METVMKYCSFCGSSQNEVAHLIEAQIAIICDRCVHACAGIITERQMETAFRKVLAEKDAPHD